MDFWDKEGDERVVIGVGGSGWQRTERVIYVCAHTPKKTRGA
jgi:hypothetical protein